MKIKHVQVSVLLLGSLLFAACGQSTVAPGGTSGTSTGGTSTGGTSTPGNSTGGTSTGGTSTPANIPSPFTFITTYAPGGEIVSSNIITVSGLSGPTTLSYSSDGDATLYVNGQAVTSPVTINNGDTVQLKVIAAATPGATVTTTVMVAGYSGIFKVITYQQNLQHQDITISPANSTVDEGETVRLTTNADPSQGYTFQVACSNEPITFRAQEGSPCDVNCNGPILSVHAPDQLPCEPGCFEPILLVRAQVEPSCYLSNVTPTSADFTSYYPGLYYVNLVDQDGNVVAYATIDVLDED